MPTTHTVDCSAGEKIQDKVAIAKPGDTILASGNCSENVAISADVVLVTRNSQAGVFGNSISGRWTAPRAPGRSRRDALTALRSAERRDS